ncbi:acyl-CoA dehydrogenase [Streptomyces subrutilus]|uniref:Acyl-CoA dehydrogenase n=2 Tax=Streptomyces subrutilus TaxID=36818 RepID=A0A918V2N0_9ACTN|nr:acyl-CoA dehydrogenase [Streptomyces subrutilus]
MHGTAYGARSSARPSHGPGRAAWMDEVREEAAADFAQCVADLASGALDLPLPGGGRTADRFRALASVARRDLSLVRLVEGHADALAILAELGGPEAGPRERWGVWAAEPPGQGLTASRGDRGWVLDGLKRYCSGAHSCTRALVTATAEDGRRLFAVTTGAAPGAGPGAGRCRPVEGSWQALGMAASDSADVVFEDVPAVPVGGVEAYVDRPGFQHGGIGVAACWYGGARAVADLLGRTAARRGPDPLTDAHLGAVDMRLHAAAAVLARAAAEIDADPGDAGGTARRRSLRVRAFVESVCADVLTHVGRATGAEPLCHDPSHTRHATDLAVYVRQHHGERNLAELGRLVAGTDQR